MIEQKHDTNILHSAEMTDLLNLPPQIAYEIALNKDARTMEQVLEAMSDKVDFICRPEFFIASIKNNSYGAEVLGVIFRYARGQINIDTFLADLIMH
jgi:hypothetical protein